MMSKIRTKTPPGKPLTDEQKRRLTDALRPLVAPVRDEVRGLRDEVRSLRDEVRSLRGKRDSDALLSKSNVADLLSVSERTVQKLLTDGELPSCMIRGQRRIPRQAVMAYVERHVREADSE